MSKSWMMPVEMVGSPAKSPSTRTITTCGQRQTRVRCLAEQVVGHLARNDEVEQFVSVEPEVFAAGVDGTIDDQGEWSEPTAVALPPCVLGLHLEHVSMMPAFNCPGRVGWCHVGDGVVSGLVFDGSRFPVLLGPLPLLAPAAGVRRWTG